MSTATATADDDGRRQIRPADLPGMSSEEIAAAWDSGRLRELMTGRPVVDVPATGQLTAEHLQHMTPAEIAAAYRAGRLREVTGPPPATPAA